METQEVNQVRQMSGAIRDRIIRTYREEIESHKINERNFTQLLARIQDL